MLNTQSDKHKTRARKGIQIAEDSRYAPRVMRHWNVRRWIYSHSTISHMECSLWHCKVSRCVAHAMPVRSPRLDNLGRRTFSSFVRELLPRYLCRLHPRITQTFIVDQNKVYQETCSENNWKRSAKKFKSLWTKTLVFLFCVVLFIFLLVRFFFVVVCFASPVFSLLSLAHDRHQRMHVILINDLLIRRIRSMQSESFVFVQHQQLLVEHFNLFGTQQRHLFVMVGG